MKILIIQTAFIGDVVLATSIVEKLSEHYPDATIDFVLRKGNENLLSDHPRINRILIWDKKERKFHNLKNIIGEIRKEKYDLLINLQRFGSTGLMTFLSGARRKIGFAKNPFSFCYDEKHEHKIGNGIHETVRNHKLIETLTDGVVAKPRLYIPNEATEKVNKYKEQPYITLAPASVWFTKQYPRERWVDFLKKLDYRGVVYLIGAPGDRPVCQQMINASGKGINLCGELSPIESVALMKDAEMNYVNDSAPMHFASSVNAPTAAIFCSTIPGFGFGPLASQSTVLETKEQLSCRPCGLHGKRTCPKGHFKCSNIDAERLIQLLRK